MDSFNLPVFTHSTTIKWETNVCRLLETDTRHNVFSPKLLLFCKSWNLVWNSNYDHFKHHLLSYLLLHLLIQTIPFSSGNKHVVQSMEGPCSCTLSLDYYPGILSFSESTFIPVLLSSLILLILVFWLWYAFDWCSTKQLLLGNTIITVVSHLFFVTYTQICNNKAINIFYI